MGRSRLAVVWVLVLAVLGAAPAIAGPYTRLQVLLPGETAAPGTSTGKTGTPRAQVANIPFTVTIRACDSGWNTVTSATNVIQVLASDASATLPAPGTLQAGVRTVTVTLNAQGSFTIYAHDQSDVTIADAASAAVSVQVLQGFRFSHVGHDQTAGKSFSVTITAVDPPVNTVRGFNGTVNLKELTNFGDAETSPQVVTLSGGTWSGSITVYRVDETTTRGAVLYAWLPAIPGKDGTSEYFNVHPGSASRVQVVLPGQTTVPGSASGLTGTPASQVSGQPFVIRLLTTDDWWNPVYTDHNIRVTSSDPAGTTPSSVRMDHASATASVTLRTVGTHTLTVSDLSNSHVLGMTTVGFSVLPSGANHFVIGTIGSPQVAGVPTSVIIRATDAAGNTIPTFNSDAVLYANTGLGSMSPDMITFSQGMWSGTVVFRGAGANVSFTCADFAATPHTGTSNHFEVRPGAFAGLQVLLPGETVQPGTGDGKTGTPSAQSAGALFTVTVRAVDTYWNLVTTASDRVRLGSTDAFAGIAAETTLVNGQALVPARLYRTGPQRIWASDTTQTSIRPDTSAAVTVNGGPFARIVLLAPGEVSAPGTATGRAGAATDQSINYSFTVTALATDAWFNPVHGIGDRIHLTCDDPLATLPADQVMVDGRAELSLRLARGGYNEITAADVSRPTVPPSATQVRAISSGFHLEAQISPATARAGEPFTLTVHVTNDAGSVIQEINSFVTLDVQNASTRAGGRGSLLTSQFQLLQGQRSIAETYTFAEPIVIVAHDDAGNAPATTNVVTITPGEPAAIRLTSDPSWVGGNKHALVSARLVDDFDNGVTGQAMTFQLALGTGSLTPIDAATDSSGVARADFQGPRSPETDRVHAAAGSLSADLDIATAFVDPGASGGTVTNYPNPFHPPAQGTTLAYKLDDDAGVTIRIFTQTGELVREEHFDRASTGGHAGLNGWEWDGRNGAGRLVASGGYVVFIEAQGNGETLHVMRRKIAVVR